MNSRWRSLSLRQEHLQTAGPFILTVYRSVRNRSRFVFISNVLVYSSALSSATKFATPEDPFLPKSIRLNIERHHDSFIEKKSATITISAETPIFKPSDHLHISQQVPDPL